MILIITHREDFTADFVIDKLNRSKQPYFRFNCEDYLSNNVSVEFTNQANVSIAGHSEFSSVWFRRTRLPQITAKNRDEEIYLLREIDTFLNNLFGIIKGKWLSPPQAVLNAENKLLQLELARQTGFDIPGTLITTDKKNLLSFIEGNNKTLIKAIGSGRINYADNTTKLVFSNLITHEIKEQIDVIELTPAIYQEYIEKEYEIRVTVVGEDLFAASVDSQTDIESTIDWRKKRTKFEKYELPEPLKEKCFSMVRKLNISFGAFDFVKSTCGIYYFLEVNPNGQWVWIEKDTGLPISDSIIKFLTC
jgi:glutathione synthase/RimK-type ligase-like ATP-grasp enzyme